MGMGTPVMIWAHIISGDHRTVLKSQSSPCLPLWNPGIKGRLSVLAANFFT